MESSEQPGSRGRHFEPPEETTADRYGYDPLPGSSVYDTLGGQLGHSDGGRHGAAPEAAPAFDAPSFQTPGYETAGYDAPAADPPVYAAPVYAAPVYEPVAYEAAAYEPAADDAATYAPSYESPSHESPGYDVSGHPAPRYDQAAYDQATYDQAGYDPTLAARSVSVIPRAAGPAPASAPPAPAAPPPAAAPAIVAPAVSILPLASSPPTMPTTPGLAPQTPAQPALRLAPPPPPTPGAGVGVPESPVAEEVPDTFDLSRALEQMLDAGASDVHVTSGTPPLMRMHGELMKMVGHPELTPNLIQRAIYSILTQKQRERFEADLELDFAYSLPGRTRFRVNVYRQRETIGAAFRRIPYEIKSLKDLGIPDAVERFAALPRGMVLVTGPTGSGKSTTLAGLVDLANKTRKDHIMTVEDPIEFLHRHKSCMVNQREVGEDTHSFSEALKHALRQDPDIILVGELRDLETISVALTAAETGHLVFATLHTQDAAQTIDRVIDVFPPHQQQQVRVQLSGTLQGVVCQTLCKTADGRGRVVATEVMMATPAIRNLIREGKTHQIYSALQAGAQHGMHTLDQNLADLVRANRITYQQGLEKCHHVEDFNRLARRG